MSNPTSSLDLLFFSGVIYQAISLFVLFVQIKEGTWIKWKDHNKPYRNTLTSTTTQNMFANHKAMCNNMAENFAQKKSC